MGTQDHKGLVGAASQRGFWCVAMSSRTHAGQWHSGLVNPVTGQLVATIPPFKSLVSRSAVAAGTSLNERERRLVVSVPVKIGFAEHRSGRQVISQAVASAVSAPRPTNGDGTPLTKESGRAATIGTRWPLPSTGGFRERLT